MFKFKLFIGVNYPINNTPINHELDADSPHQCGSIIGKLVNDEPDAINFQILIQREDSDDVEDNNVGKSKRK